MPLRSLRQLLDPRERVFRRLPAAQRTTNPLVIDEAGVNAQLERSGLPIRLFHIDLEGFRDFRARADYEGRHPAYYHHNIDEKSLEHFTTATLAGLAPGQVVIDVASQSSVVGEVFERLYGAEVWRQDLDYPPGRNGREIGGNAAAMDVPDAFADVLTLHCSFEHFEGEADTGFIREAGRILRPGGICVIAPLYLCQHHACLVDPGVASCLEVPFDPGIRIHRADGWGNRFGRMYSMEQFIERVWKHRGDLEGEIIVMMNYADLGPGIYLRYALALRKKG